MSRAGFVVAVFVCAVFVCAGACAPPELCGADPSGALRDPEVRPTRPSPLNGFFFAAHAHNDYEHEHPLDDALAAGFASVEADVWHRDGAVVVSHDPWSQKGTLKDLYLDPLRDLLDDGRDGVHGDGAEFVLWLDLKDDTAALRALLEEQLAALPFLTQFDDVGVTDTRAVTVILTGDAHAKQQMIDDVKAPRSFARDSNVLVAAGEEFDEDDDGTVVAAALDFGRSVGSWDGAGAPPPALSRQCGCVVERAHALGRRVRLFGGPDTAAAWGFQLDHGVDFVNTDDLSGFADFARDRAADATAP